MYISARVPLVGQVLPLCIGPASQNNLRKLVLTALPPRLVPFAAGIVLISAALSKTHGLWVDPPSEGTGFDTFRFQVPLIEVELGLGFALLARLAPPITRFLVIGLFAGLLVVALAYALAGVRSCGCLGRAEVTPWLLAALDLL